MLNIKELLNSLLSAPPDAALLKGPGTVAPKNTQNGGPSFEDVLNRLAGQQGSTNTSTRNQPQENTAVQTNNAGQGTPATLPQGQTGETIGATVSETNIAISEAVHVGNTNQLIQAEQTLASLAAGLAQLMNLLAVAQQVEPQKAQETINALTGGKVTLSDIQNILNQLQPLIQKLPPEQNPLLLASNQQTALLGQFFQQLIQAQQVLLGAAQANSGGASAASTNGQQPGLGGQTAILQVNFSETQASLFERNNAQTTQVFINMESFKMSATFLQQGQEANAPTPTITLPNAQTFLNQLNQAVANVPLPNSGANPQAVPPPTAPNSVQLAAVQSDLNQSFKNLVQLLIQSGVSQAVLTTLMNNQQKQVDNFNFANNSQNAAPIVSANNLTKPAPAATEIQPVAPAELNAGPANNADVLNVPSTVETLPPPKNFAPSTLDTVAFNNVLEATAAPVTAAPGTTQESVTAQAESVSITPLQGNGVPNVETATVNVLNPPLNIATASAPGPLGQGNGLLNAGEVTALNDVVGRLNSAVLQVITGGIQLGSNTPTPDPRITLDQVLASLSATGPSSTLPPTFGNPSVPINNPIPTQTPTAPQNGTTLFLTALAQTQAAQTNASQSTAINTAQPTGVSVGTAVNPSVTSEEPVNQATPTALPQPANSALVNQTLVVPPGNGVVAAATASTNNAVTATVTVPPSANANVNPVPTPPVGSSAVNPLPQVATVPGSANPPAAVAANAPLTPQPLTPAALNRVVVPPPTSQTPVVPATISVGEAVKTEVPPAAVVRNENLNFQNTAASTQPLSSVIPVSPEAVKPTDNVLGAAGGLKTLDILDKNAPNNPSVLEANTLVSLANAANAAPDISQSSTPAGLSNTASTGNFNATSILGQISQQLTAQASQAKALSHLSFQLIPESLGRVTVQIALVDQSVSARILVTNPEVRDTLQHHMVDLKTALNQAGLQIDQLQVQVQGGGGNLLAQYYQYQQEGSGYRLPASVPAAVGGGPENPENTGVSTVSPGRLSLVDILA